jgi:hypothetical protein
VPELINQSILSFFDFFGHDVFNCDVHILELDLGDHILHSAFFINKFTPLMSLTTSSSEEELEASSS